jgi:hypothetical protein
MRRRHALGAALLCLLPSTALHAQTGRADLRYHATAPLEVTYVTVDSSSTTLSGTPLGEMQMLGFNRSVTAYRMAPGGNGRVEVTATVLESGGAMTMPMMGEMPLPGGPRPAVRFSLGPQGPDPDEVQGLVPAGGSNPTELIGSSRPFAELVFLPGRVVNMGETWTDTIATSLPDDQGLRGTMVIVAQGSYVADTTVAGTLYHVLRINSTIRVNSTGNVRGMDMQQEMQSVVRETVLWDAARHIPWRRDGTGDMTMNVATQGMVIVTSASVRSVSQARDGG